MLGALKSPSGHHRKHDVRLLRLSGDQAYVAPYQRHKKKIKILKLSSMIKTKLFSSKCKRF